MAAHSPGGQLVVIHSLRVTRVVLRVLSQAALGSAPVSHC